MGCGWVHLSGEEGRRGLIRAGAQCAGCSVVVPSCAGMDRSGLIQCSGAGWSIAGGHTTAGQEKGGFGQNSGEVVEVMSVKAMLNSHRSC